MRGKFDGCGGSRNEDMGSAGIRIKPVRCRVASVTPRGLPYRLTREGALNRSNSPLTPALCSHRNPLSGGVLDRPCGSSCGFVDVAASRACLWSLREALGATRNRFGSSSIPEIPSPARDNIGTWFAQLSRTLAIPIQLRVGLDKHEGQSDRHPNELPLRLLPNSGERRRATKQQNHTARHRDEPPRLLGNGVR